MAHDHPQAQAHLRHVTQQLETLDQLTAELYATHTSTTQPPPPERLIPCIPQARQLVNKACASWKNGIEQLMVTSKLVTVYKPRTKTTGPSKRKVKQSKRTQTDDDRVTYRDATLSRHGLIGTTLKQSLPTLMNVNRPHLELLSQLMKSIVDKHSDLHAYLHALNRQQQDLHDIRIVKTDECRHHHQTPDTGVHAPTPTQSSASHPIETCDDTANLAATINTQHSIVPTHVRYNNWSPSLPISPVFLQTDTPTTIYRKYQRLLTINASTIRILRQIKRQLIHTIGRQRTDTINHNINISQLRRACQAA